MADFLSTDRSSNSSSNLVPGDNNGFHDIFVYDRVLKTIKRVSISSTGEESNSDSYKPSINADGSVIAFYSHASNLVAGDNNGFGDVFVYDQTLNTVKRVSISRTGEEGNDYSYKPSISADGHYIAFTSSANNLVSGDNNYRDDVFVHDQISGITERVSVSSTGEEFRVDCEEPSISGDGRYVAFALRDIGPAGAPIGVDLPSDYSYFISQVLVHDRISGTTKVVSISSTGDLGNGDSSNPSINADGRAVAFSSWADNLITNDTNGVGDIFVHTSDNIPPTVSGTITPNMVRSGNSVTIRVLSDPDTKSITALISGETFNLVKKADGTWTLKYTVPHVSDGIYSIFLNAVDNAGNQGNKTLNFTVDNTPPTIQTVLNPVLTRTGNTININVTACGDTQNITATILGRIHNLIGNNSTWTLKYTVPHVSDGIYSIFLNAVDNAGNQGNSTLNFTVDNTPPVISGVVNHDLTKKGNNITINANSSPDTANLTASILGTIYNLTKRTNKTWTLNYTIPSITSGIYDILLKATDYAGNQGNSTLNFTVDNTPSTVNN